MKNKTDKFNEIASHLQQLGYPDASKVKFSDFEWLLENKMLLGMFEKIIERCDERNVIDESQMKKFQEMKDSGETILEGKALENALDNISVMETEFDLDSERQEIENLKMTIAKQKQNLKCLSLRREQLRKHYNKLESQNLHIQTVLFQAEQEFEKNFNDCLAEAEMSGGILKEVTKASDSLLEDFAEAEKKANSESVFFSQVMLDEFKMLNDGFLSNLAAYIRKQFEDGICEVVNNLDGPDCEFFDAKHPDYSLVKGRDLEEYKKTCKSFALLQESIPKGKMQRVQAMMENHGSQAMLQKIKSLNSDISKKFFSTEIITLREYEKKAIMRLKIANGQIPTILESIKMMIEDYSIIESRKIVGADYSLKLIRQQYYLSKQKQIMKFLITQRALHEIMCDILFCEFENFKSTDHLLKNLSTSLWSNLQNMQLCQTKLSQLNTTVSEPLDSSELKDSCSFDSFNLDLGSPRSANVCNNSLEKSYKLENQNKDIYETLEPLFNQNMTDISSIREKITDQLMEIVFKKSIRNADPRLTKVSKPVEVNDFWSLTPVTDTFIFKPFISKLEDKVAFLEDLCKKIISKVYSFKKKIKAQPLIQMQRKCFIYFFTNPEKLRDLVKKHHKKGKIEEIVKQYLKE